MARPSEILAIGASLIGYLKGDPIYVGARVSIDLTNNEVVTWCAVVRNYFTSSDPEDILFEGTARKCADYADKIVDDSGPRNQTFVI